MSNVYLFDTMKQDDLQQWWEKPGLSQQDLAEYLGVSRGLVNLVERGQEAEGSGTETQET
jgi:transcriptional regulator with XRE-family HTH domain